MKRPEPLTLKAGTRSAEFDAYVIDDNATVLNIIDTPG
ncbi:unnamed protein product, partial [Rotaria sp. Silwood1]